MSFVDLCLSDFFSISSPDPYSLLRMRDEKNIGSGRIQNRKDRIWTFCDLRSMIVYIEILQPDWSLCSKGKLKIEPLWEFVLKDIMSHRIGIKSSFYFDSVLY